MTKKTVLPTYDGPTLAECLKIEDPIEALKELGEEPKRPLVMLYDHEGNPEFTPEALQSRNLDMWRRQLHIIHIDRWVRTLPLKVRWALVQEYEMKAYPHSKEDFGESTRRYTAEAEVNRRCAYAVWATTKEAHESNQQARTAEAADATAEAEAVPQVQLRRKRKTASTTTLPLTN